MGRDLRDLGYTLFRRTLIPAGQMLGGCEQGVTHGAVKRRNADATGKLGIP